MITPFGTAGPPLCSTTNRIERTPNMAGQIQ